MGALLFFHFRVTNVKLINEKSPLNITLSKWNGLHHFITFLVFSLLCCKYICDIYLNMLDLNGLCKFNNMFIYKKEFGSCDSKDEWPHAGLYDYNGRQIKLFQIKCFDGREINRAYADVCVKCLRSILAYRLSCKFHNNLRTSK